MLYDPKHQKRERILDIIAWLQTQNPHAEYSYTDAYDCLLARYLKARGLWEMQYTHSHTANGYFGDDGRIIQNTADLSEDHRAGWTYGKALARAQSELTR